MQLDGRSIYDATLDDVLQQIARLHRFGDDERRARASRFSFCSQSEP